MEKNLIILIIALCAILGPRAARGQGSVLIFPTIDTTGSRAKGPRRAPVDTLVKRRVVDTAQVDTMVKPRVVGPPVDSEVDYATVISGRHIRLTVTNRQGEAVGDEASGKSEIPESNYVRRGQNVHIYLGDETRSFVLRFDYQTTGIEAVQMDYHQGAAHGAMHWDLSTVRGTSEEFEIIIRDDGSFAVYKVRAEPRHGLHARIS